MRKGEIVIDMGLWNKMIQQISEIQRIRTSLNGDYKYKVFDSNLSQLKATLYEQILK